MQIDIRKSEGVTTALGRVARLVSRRSPHQGSGDAPFLASDELREFLEDYPRFPRTVISDRRYGRRERREIGAAARDLVETNTSAFRCGIVSVRQGDGMSWAATAVDRAVAAARPEVQRVHLRGTGSTTRLPAIGAWVSPRALASEARRAGLTERFRLLSSWMALVPIAAVLAALLESWTSSGLTPATIAALTVAALAEVAREVGISRATETSSSSMRALARVFADESDPEAHARVVRALAKRLTRGPFPRVVIVDDFGRLDATTAAVLRYYIAHRMGRGLPETWILFEDAAERAFAGGALGTGLPRLRHYELELLDDDTRRRLAAHAGTDRFDYATVRGVRGTTGLDESGDLHRLLNEHRLSTTTPEDSFGELDLLYLLSLTGAWGRGPALSAHDLERTLRQGTKVRAELLERFLGCEPTLHMLRSRMDAMFSNLGRLVDVSVPEDSRFEREIEFRRADLGRVLAERSRELGLPSAGLGHLFWAIYWHDRLQQRPVEPFWAHRLAIHLVEGLPTLHDQTPSAAVTDALFEAVVRSVRWCIHSCVLEPVDRLLEAALALIDDESDDGAERRAERLLHLAWEAYTVLGDESILATVMTVESWRQEPSDDVLGTSDGSPQPSDRESHDALEALFLQSLSVRQDRASTSWHRLLGARNASALPLRTYGHMRGAWLAVTLTYLADWDPMPGDALLPAARDAVYSDSWSGLIGARKRLSAGEPELAAIDYLNLSIGLWAVATLYADDPQAFAGGIESIAESIAEDLVPLASTLYQRAVASTARGGSDFVMHVLARELLVVIAAVAVVMAHAVDDPIAGTLTRAAEDALGHLTVTGPASKRKLSSEVHKQFDLLAVTWGRLGLPQLSAYADLRAMQYEVLRRVVDPEMLSQVDKALRPAAAQRGHVAVLAKAIVAATSEWSDDITAQLVSAIAKEAIDSQMGDELVTELVGTALHAGHAHDVSMGDAMGHLLVADGSASDKLERWLNHASDEQAADMSLILLNSLSNVPDRPDVATRVIAALRNRQASAEDEPAIKRMRDEIDAWKLRVEIESGAPIDIDHTLAEWRDRRSKRYAWVLYLLSGRTSTEALGHEVVKVLESTDRSVNQSSFMLLAVRSGERGPLYGGELGRRVTTAAVEFTAEAIGSWSGKLLIDQTIDAYELLRDHYPARREEYEAELLYWDLAQHQRDAVGKLQSLYEQERYFAVFAHFCESLFRWGLPVDDLDSITRSSGRDDREAEAVVREWLERDGSVPPAFVDEDGTRVLRARFYIVGRHLFDLPAEDAAIEEAQGDFDLAAQQAIETLYWLIAKLPSIPQEIRHVFQGHRERFATYTALS